MTQTPPRHWVRLGVALWCLKRAYVIVGFSILVAPLWPLVLISTAGSGMVRFADWCADGRAWTINLVERAERFAAKHGVRL